MSGPYDEYIRRLPKGIHIVAFCGKKFHGKDSCARIWMQRDPKYVQINFADRVRQVCQIVFGFKPDEMNNPDLKEVALERYPFESFRSVAQKIAEEGIRKQWPDAWIHAWARHVVESNTLSNGSPYLFGNVVVSDFRYPNEGEALKALGATTIKVVRPGMPDNDAHISESYIDELETDYTIQNDGGVDWHDRLAAQVTTIYDNVRLGTKGA